MYGPVASAWTIAEGTFRLTVEVPANTRATVRLPGAAIAGVSESGSPLGGAAGLTRSRQDGRDVVVETGSGRYQFAYTMP